MALHYKPDSIHAIREKENPNSKDLLKIIPYGEDMPQVESGIAERCLYLCVKEVDEDGNPTAIEFCDCHGNVYPTTAKSVIDSIKTVNDALAGKAPENHASSSKTYGVGTGSNYGHVKLSDSTSSTSAASAGIAASPKAVKTAYDLANDAKSDAAKAQETADNAVAYTTETATLDTANTLGGTIRYQRYGRMVVVDLHDLLLKVSAINAATWKDFRIASGLPKPEILTARCHMNIEAGQSNAGTFRVNTDGEIEFYHHDTTLVRGAVDNAAKASGNLTYISVI